MKRLSVSIIIPTLNEEKYIEKTLKALKNQDFEGKFEIIVADGMSKDNTVKIAEKYADKIILVKKRGIAAGRNEGARVAKGDVLIFVDADTVLLPNTISELVKAFKEKKVVGAACPIIPLSAKIEDFFLYWGYNQYMKATLKTKRPHVPGICCAYRKDAFWEVNGFNEKMKAWEDYDLSERISKLGKIVLVESTLAITSPRRIKAWGKLGAVLKYLKLHFNYLLKGKSPCAKEYEPVR